MPIPTDRTSEPTPTAAPRLTTGRKIGYGIGDVGFGLVFLTASQFLLYYYTDIVGLSPDVAGWVFGAAIVWDALIDPVMGGIASRTRSRWGRFRPYLLWGAIPLGIAWSLIFLPTGLTGTMLVIWALGAHLLFRSVYTVASMPYLSLSAAMTEDSGERSTLTAYRLVLQALAGVLVAFATLPLVKVLGGGQVGFFKVGAIYGAGAAACIMITFMTVREVSTGDAIQNRPSFRDMFDAIRSNSAFWLVCGAFLIFAVATVFFNKSLPYFMKYGLGREELMGPALGVYAMSITFTIPIWGQVAKRSSKQRAFFIGMSIVLVTYALLWLAPLDFRVWLPLIALLGIGSGAIFLSHWAMMPDTVELNEWNTGHRAEGAVFGFVSFVQKSSMGIAAGLLGEVLAYIGYMPNVEQSPETLASLKFIMLAVPAVFAVLSSVAIYYYPLDPARHARLVRALQWRRKRGRAVAGK